MEKIIELFNAFISDPLAMGFLLLGAGMLAGALFCEIVSKYDYIVDIIMGND